MLCQRCRTSLLSRLSGQHQAAAWCARQAPLQLRQMRFYGVDGKPTVSAPPPPPAPRQPAAGDSTAPSAISSATPGISQPLSAPAEVRLPGANSENSTKTSTAPSHAPSSCLAGTTLRGLNYFKNKPEVVALEDSEYPDWLWGLLEDPSKKSQSQKGGIDPNTLNKKQRKRYEKKQAARAAVLPPRTPAHHQAVDITPAPYNQPLQASADTVSSAVNSLEKRDEITKSARAARRKSIREANFLRGL